MILKSNSPGAKVSAAFLILLLTIAFFALHPQDDPLQYYVSVNVMTIPVFAVDGKGNPVHDLEKNDLELRVNGKAVEILEFKRYEFGHEETVREEKESLSGAVMADGERVMIIILDSMFNSPVGARRGKEIAINLIREGLPGDSFLLLETSPAVGLRYMAGPEKDAEVLITKIKSLNAASKGLSQDVYANRHLSDNLAQNAMTSQLLETPDWKSLVKLNKLSDDLRYRHRVRHFARVLSRFKYALKAIDKPKIVFLVSEGISRGAFKNSGNPFDPDSVDDNEERGDPLSSSDKGFVTSLGVKETDVSKQNKVYSAVMLQYLTAVVKAVNNGGSVLYTINPRPMKDFIDNDVSGEMSLRYMAGESGGKYFAGAKPKQIVERIKKTTGAYYEIFCGVTPEMGENMKMEVICSRKDVRVHSLVHTERNRPYHRMAPVQKKIFALNVVSGGGWSRMVGKVMKVKYTRSKTKQQKGRLTLDIPLPNVMRNKKADIFLIRTDPVTQETHIDSDRRTFKDIAKMNFKPRKGGRQYFVIIEPGEPYCIYNKI